MVNDNDVKSWWKEWELKIHQFGNKPKAPVKTELDKLLATIDQKQLIEETNLIIHAGKVSSHNFKTALKTALGDAPNSYLMNEEYKALLIEDYRQVLNELIGLDFDFTIKNDNQAVEA